MWAAIYRYDGPVDCVIAGCGVVIFDPSDNRIVEVPYHFAEGVTAPEPELILEPDGPYFDGQDVTVRRPWVPSQASTSVGRSASARLTRTPR